MKKILFVLLAIVAVNLPSFAVITPEEAASEKYIQGHGHSDEMSRLIDLQNCQISGVKSQYKGKDPAWYSFFPVKMVRRAFIYFDPSMDDNKFMQNDIHFTTKYDDL